MRNFFLNDTVRAFMLALLIALFAIGISSCSPQKRLNRLVKNHPELLTKDTVWAKATFTIPEIKIDTNIRVSTDVSGVDSIIGKYAHLLDSLSTVKIKGDIKNYIINRPILKDTFMIQLEDGLSVKLFQNGDMLGWRMTRPEKVVEKDVAVPVETVKAEFFTPWYERYIFEKWPELIMLFVILLLILKNGKSNKT